MDKLPMCRICLAENVKMRVLNNTFYQEIYQRLTMMPFETKDSRPIHACYVCCARLRNSYELRKNCLQSEELFTQMLQSSAPNLDNLLGSLISKRLSVKHSVIQIDIEPEPRASSDRDDNVECTATTQVKIELVDAEDMVDLDGVAENRNHDNDLQNEDDPLCTTNDFSKNEKESDVTEIELSLLPKNDIPDRKPVTFAQDITSSSPMCQPTPATVQSSSSHATSASNRVDPVFVTPKLEPTTDNFKTLLVKRKLDTLVKARTFANDKHAIQRDILRIQNKTEREKLKYKMLKIQLEQIDLEIRSHKIRKLND